MLANWVFVVTINCTILTVCQSGQKKQYRLMPNLQFVRRGIVFKETAEVIVNLFFDSIKNALASKDKVEVRGFGSFHVRSRKERNDRNPKTGTPVTVPAK